MAMQNKNRFLSSVLAWLQGSQESIGQRKFPGFQVYTAKEVDGWNTQVLTSCRTALTQLIECEDTIETFARLELRDTVGNSTLADAMCDKSCGQSLSSWFNNVFKTCEGFEADNGTPLTMMGGRMWAGYNETCLRDDGNTQYCVGELKPSSLFHDVKIPPADEPCQMSSASFHQPTRLKAWPQVTSVRLVLPGFGL
jgi:hypothetical protein